MAANDFLTFAAGPGTPNVLAQDLYEELAAVAVGFQKGLLPSNQINKVLRQTAMMSSAIAQLVADKTDADVLDDGERATLMVLIEQMIGIVSLEQTGAMVFKGTWNANTNTPALASGIGVAGWLYTVSVAGATDLDGISVWNVGDKAVFNGATWEKIEGQATEVLTVAGRVGNVILAAADITDSSAFGRSILSAANAAAAVVLLGIATQAEAEAGADNTKIMTSLRVAQAIAAQAPGGSASMPWRTPRLRGDINNGPGLVTADFQAYNLVLYDPNDDSVAFVPGFRSVSIDISQVQAGTLPNQRDQAAAFGANSDVHLYFIWDFDTGVAGIASLNSPIDGGPDLPGFYTHWSYICATRLNGAVFRPASVFGDKLTLNPPVAVVTNGTSTVGAQVSTMPVPQNGSNNDNAIPVEFEIEAGITNTGDGPADSTLRLRTGTNGRTMVQDVRVRNPTSGRAFATIIAELLLDRVEGVGEVTYLFTNEQNPANIATRSANIKVRGYRSMYACP